MTAGGVFNICFVEPQPELCLLAKVGFLVAMICGNLCFCDLNLLVCYQRQPTVYRDNGCSGALDLWGAPGGGALLRY